MKTIYKYVLPAQACLVPMPTAAKLLSVAEQYGQPCVWAAVDTGLPMRKRRFFVVGTGWELGPDFLSDVRFVGTVVYAGGGLIWHVFDGGEE